MNLAQQSGRSEQMTSFVSANRKKKADPGGIWQKRGFGVAPELCDDAGGKKK
ncbi:MAG: hypothetical protein QM296_03010 [Bacillota bacterium]|nr:hypothetical protein [Bacillota bacterium]